MDGSDSGNDRHDGNPWKSEGSNGGNGGNGAQWGQMRRASGEAPGQAKSCTRMSRLIPKHVTLAATTDEQKGLAPELTTSNNTTTPLHGQYSMSSNVITPHMHILTHHMCSREHGTDDTCNLI